MGLHLWIHLGSSFKHYFPLTSNAISYVQPGSVIYLWLFLREDETHLALSVLWLLLSLSAASRCFGKTPTVTRGYRMALRLEAFAHTYLAFGTIASTIGLRRVYAGWLSIWCVLMPPPIIRWVIGNDWVQCARNGLILFGVVDLVYQYVSTRSSSSFRIDHVVWRSMFCSVVRSWRYNVRGRQTLFQDLLLVWHLKSSGLW